MEAVSYGNLGRIFNCLGEYVKAKEHCEKALAIAEKIGDGEIEATSYGNLGHIFDSLGEYLKAKKHYEKQLQSHRKLATGVQKPKAMET